MGERVDLKFSFAFYFFQAATLGYILQRAIFSRSGAAAGMMHQGLHLPGGAGTRAECGGNAGMPPEYCRLLLPVLLYFPSLSGLRVFEINIYIYIYIFFVASTNGGR